MLKKANIEHLAKKNFRYRILNVDNEHYLVDVDRPFIISYFFPWFLYFTSHWAIRLTEHDLTTIQIGFMLFKPYFIYALQYYFILALKVDSAEK